MHESIKILVDDIYKKLSSSGSETLELEVRLGQINDIQTDNRIYLPSKVPVVFYENKIYKFNPGVSELDFDFFNKKLFDYAKSKNKEEEIDNFQDLQVITKQARIGIRDNKIVNAIRKVRLTNFDIYFPDFLYDIRVSISDEIPSKNVYEIDQILKDDGKMGIQKFKRERKRTSFTLDKYVFDLTKVKMSDYETNEVEMELSNDVYGDKNKISEFLDYAFNFLKRKV